jgi:3-polyprenyl-4-hydroxybenzoate decarboxylase
MPISPPLYFLPRSVDEYVGAFTTRVLAQLGVAPGKGWRAEEFE